MGTGLVVGCGGVAEGSHQVSAGGAPDGGTRGSSVSGGSNGTNSAGALATGDTGGGLATSTAGASNAGGGPVSSVGGAPPDLDPVEPGPFACPPQQWTCTHSSCGSMGWVLPDGCECDPKQPLSQSDCGPGEAFVCQNATTSSDGRPLARPVALACACVPQAMGSCAAECGAAYNRGDASWKCSISQDGLSASCGCAIVYLK